MNMSTFFFAILLDEINDWERSKETHSYTKRVKIKSATLKEIISQTESV